MHSSPVTYSKTSKMDDYDHPNSDKQPILPPAYEQNTYGISPPVQTVIHVNNSVPCPNDYFVFSLCVLIFCCLPFGIVGLVKSSEVRTKAALGDREGALIASAQAKNWSVAGLITGLVIIVTVVIINIVA